MNNREPGENKAMTKQPGMFWSGETLGERLKMLIDPFVPGRVHAEDDDPESGAWH